MSGDRFKFAAGNRAKLFAAPLYLLALCLSWFVPRSSRRWAFGSGIGVGEGALEVARALREDEPEARITWLVADQHEAALAEAEGFTPLMRSSWAGFWSTLRAGQIVITHGMGDVNRYGVFGGHITNLIHGAPLKRLHFDSTVTTAVGASRLGAGLLRRMYSAGADQIDLFVAGSTIAADRLRSAYRVDPGAVRVLGDPRDDRLALQAKDPHAAALARDAVRDLLALENDTSGDTEALVLYAPTWRDGEPDPAAPTPEEAAAIHELLERRGARLLIRSHPLGEGAYEAVLGDRVHALGADLARDITPLLGAFDIVITDYSSIAVDFSLLGRPIVWFAPDLNEYTLSRGLYEPLHVTAASHVEANWASTLERLDAVLEPGPARRSAEADSRMLAERFFAHPEGGAARRVIAMIKHLQQRDKVLVPERGVFFESFYGRQASCNPLALDREIARRWPDLPRYWSVAHEGVAVPEGAIALLVGGREWFAARRRARLLIVNDWLRYDFRRRRKQFVLQTWHGTMLKHLALGRPKVGARTRLAITRESRRWSLLLSQNPHATVQFRRSYAFGGPIIETGYPRDDRLALAAVGGARIGLIVSEARRVLGIPAGVQVLAYTPTWRDAGVGVVDTLDVHALAEELGDDWVIVARGHTRSAGSYMGANARVIDASAHPDVNDVILAADLLVTDYSSVMFDAAVARVPMAFFVPDLSSYRDEERGFTFDFEELAPGPLLATREQLVGYVQKMARVLEEEPFSPAYEAWRQRFAPHDDGHAAERVVEELVKRRALVA